MTLIDDLAQSRLAVLSLRRSIRALSVDQVSRQSLRDEAARLATHWFNDLAPELAGTVGAETLERYSALFSRLLRLSRPNNRKASYIEVLGALSRGWTDELVHPLQVAPPPRKSMLAGVLAELRDPGETAYLEEATKAAEVGLFRAAAVLGWCAAIDRVHRRVEAAGFAAFNVASARMASETKGRYKRFSQTQNIHSIAELREVFDTVVLWVIEGMGLIDTNEHQRLLGCFHLRSQCAHPGNAPVTEYNLMSFFSDINEIVLKNPRFDVAAISERSDA